MVDNVEPCKMLSRNDYIRWLMETKEHLAEERDGGGLTKVINLHFDNEVENIIDDAPDSTYSTKEFVVVLELVLLCDVDAESVHEVLQEIVL